MIDPIQCFRSNRIIHYLPRLFLHLLFQILAYQIIFSEDNLSLLGLIIFLHACYQHRLNLFLIHFKNSYISTNEPLLVDAAIAD